ncbi:MAG: hypothetical protein M3010_05745, partial [Candidatus Dormibacteraeota bacterium]|nr:hypothetical protein [Candidatus Dormibacteraeota bacterium]
MSHLNDGALRRVLDEPATTSAADAAHLEACADCRDRADGIRAEAAGVSSLLAVPDGDLEPAVALLRLRRMAATQPAPGRALGSWLEGVRRQRGFRPAAASLLALGLMGGLVATGVADGFIQTFQPQSFVAVPVNPGSLSSLPDLSQFGTYMIDQKPDFKASSTAAAAESGSGVGHVLVPTGALPASVTGVPSYQGFTQLKGHFKFDLARARAYEQSKGKRLPSAPNGVDGTTLSVTAGPGVLTIYGAPTASSADGSVTRPRRAEFAIPSLAIVQMSTPTVVSDGAPVSVLENYLASLPGVPPDLAVQIKNLGNPATTLPVPVPTGQGSHEVTINGSKGLFVGDSTGLG